MFIYILSDILTIMAWQTNQQSFSPLIPVNNRSNGGLGATLIGIFFLTLLLLASQLAFLRLGIDRPIAIFLLLIAVLGSGFNLFITRYRSSPYSEIQELYLGFFPFPVQTEVTYPSSSMRVFINVGGALIPVLISLAVLAVNPTIIPVAILGIIIISLITHRLATIIPNRGIAIPLFLLPLIGISTGLVLQVILSNWGITLTITEFAIIVYSSLTLGTLIGADLLNIPNLSRIRTPAVSIGGAGIFDGVFLAGVFALLFIF